MNGMKTGLWTRKKNIPIRNVVSIVCPLLRSIKNALRAFALRNIYIHSFTHSFLFSFSFFQLQILLCDRKVSSYQRPFQCFAIHWCSFIYAQSSVFCLVKSFVWNCWRWLVEWQQRTKPKETSMNNQWQQQTNGHTHTHTLHIIWSFWWSDCSIHKEIRDKKKKQPKTFEFFLLSVSLLGFIRLLKVLRVLSLSLFFSRFFPTR